MTSKFVEAQMKPDFRRKDIFSFLVTYTTIPIMQDVTSVLMHKVPSNIDIDHVKNYLLDNQVLLIYV